MGLSELIARTEARARAGANQTYPRHRGRDPHARRGPGAPAAAPVPLPAHPPCVFEGVTLERCHTCAGPDESRHVRECELYEDRCTRAPVSAAARACTHCPGRLHEAPPVASDARTVRFDHRNLFPHLDRLRFNAGLTADPAGGYVLAWRDSVARSRVWFGRLDGSFRPVGGPEHLRVDHPLAAEGQDDPRLWWHAGALHCSFTGVARDAAGVRASMLYARLRPDLTTEAAFAPEFAGRASWEKNWAFFSHDGALYAVYYIAPRHRILRVAGARCEEVHATETPPLWTGGELRGGTPPLRLGDEYVCFAHASTEEPRPGMPGHKRYVAPAYTFEARPPFRVTAITPAPVWEVDESVRPYGLGYSVLFPCGAVADGDGFVVSMGHHDHWIELRRLAAADLRRALAPI